MLFGFPAPRPDELIYSVVARYGQRLGLGENHRPLTKHVFGSKDARASVLLPTHVNHLASRLPEDYPVSWYEWVVNHTLVPFFSPFVERADFSGPSALSEKWAKRGLHLTLSVSSFGAGVSSLRACRSCFEEDVQETGESIWRRIHQCPTALVCPHHGEPLLSTSVQISGSKNRHRWYPLTKDLIKESTPIFHGSSLHLSRALALAQTTEWFLHAHLKPQVQSVLTERYRALAERLHWVYGDGRLQKADLSRAATDYFGDEILQHLGIKSDRWASKCLETPKRPTHPVRHVLLLTFLGVSLDHFFSDDPPGLISTRNDADAPTRHRDGPCMNTFCSRFGGEIRDIFKGSHQPPLVEVTCPGCGFRYEVFKKGLELLILQDPGPLWFLSVSRMRENGATWKEVQVATGLTEYMLRKMRRRFSDRLSV